MPSTTTSVTSGAASCTAPSMASCTVAVDEGQPLQLPSSRSLATPSITPRYSTPPACEPRYGRTRSRARWIRSSTSSGCRSCSSSRLSTRGSSASLCSITTPGSPCSRSTATMWLSPSPYRPTSSRTSSSAAGPASLAVPERSAASSSSTRAPTSRTPLISLSPSRCVEPGGAPANTSLASGGGLASVPVVRAADDGDWAGQNAGPGRPRALGRQRHRHRRMHLVQHLAVAEVHVHPAGQARGEAAHGAHGVDGLELVRRVLLEDRRVLHRVLVGSRRAVDVADAGVPRGRRVRVVVRDLPAADDHVVRQHAADRLGEPAAVGLVGHAERLPGLGPPGPDLGQRLLGEVQRARGRVGLEVRPRPVPLDRVGQRPAFLVPRDLPLERP